MSRSGSLRRVWECLSISISYEGNEDNGGGGRKEEEEKEEKEKRARYLFITFSPFLF